MIPIEESKKVENGMGRDPPNQFPILNEPTGRLKFDMMHPLDFIKDILGPDLYSKLGKIICLVLGLALFFTLGWVFVLQIIAAKIS